MACNPPGMTTLLARVCRAGLTTSLVAFTSVSSLVALASTTGCAAAHAAEPEPRTAEQEAAHDAEPARLEELGDAASSFGDVTRAEEYYAAALRRGGDDQQLTRKLVSACVADSRYPLARAHAAEYVRRHPGDTRMRYILASIELAAGQRDRALVEYTRVVRERPELAAAHFALATLLLSERKDEEAARKQFLAYLELEPRGDFAEVARVSVGGEP